MKTKITLKKIAKLTAILAIAAITPLWGWTLNRQKSYVKFHIGAMFNSVDGVFKSFKLESLNVKGEDIAGAVTIQTKSIDTKNAKRDKHLRSDDFFYVSKYPTARMQLVKVQKKGKGHIAHCKLTIRGITRSMTIPVKLAKSATQIVASGKFKVNRQKFDMKYGFFLNPINDMATIAFRFLLTK